MHHISGVRRITGVSGLALAGLVLGATVALADPLDGRFVGLEDAVNTYIEIDQDGDAITGTMYGADKGDFEGETTGLNRGEGKIDLTGVGEFDYTLRLRGKILTFTLLANDQRVDFRFERDADAPAPDDEIVPPLAEDTPTPPPLDPAPNASYFYAVAGEQVGPVSFDDLNTAIADGTLTSETLVWLKGSPGWVPASDLAELAAILPPPLPSETGYYIAIDGAQQGPSTLAEIEDLIALGTANATTLAWHNGLETWAPLGEIEEFAEAFVIPPPLPNLTDDKSGPPPLPGSDDGTDPLPGGDGASIPPLPEDPAAPPVDDQLAALMRNNIAEEFPEATPEQAQSVLDCSMIALSQVDAATRQNLIDTDLKPDLTVFEASNPGVLDTLMACPTGAQLPAAPVDASVAAPALAEPEVPATDGPEGDPLPQPGN